MLESLIKKAGPLKVGNCRYMWRSGGSCHVWDAGRMAFQLFSYTELISNSSQKRCPMNEC